MSETKLALCCAVLLLVLTLLAKLAADLLA